MPRQITVNSKSYIVDTTHILGTRFVVFSIWEPKLDHSIITTFEIEGKVRWYGKFTTRNITPELDALRGMERYNAVKAYYRGLEAQSNIIIMSIYPEVEELNEIDETEMIFDTVEEAREFAAKN